MKLYQIASTFHKDAYLMLIENRTPEEEDFLKNRFCIIEYGGEKKLLGMPTIRAFEYDESKTAIESNLEENDLTHEEITDKETVSSLNDFDANVEDLKNNDEKWMIIKDNNKNCVAIYPEPGEDAFLELYVKKNYQTQNGLKKILESIFDYKKKYKIYDIYQTKKALGVTALFIKKHNIDHSALPIEFIIQEKDSTYNTSLRHVDTEETDEPILAIPIAYSKIDQSIKNDFMFSIQEKNINTDTAKMKTLLKQNKAVGRTDPTGDYYAIAEYNKEEIAGLITYSKKNTIVTINQIAIKDNCKNQNLAKMLFLFLINSNQEIQTIEWKNFRNNSRTNMAYTLLGAQQCANEDSIHYYWSLDTKKFLQEYKSLLPHTKLAIE